MEHGCVCMRNSVSGVKRWRLEHLCLPAIGESGARLAAEQIYFREGPALSTWSRGHYMQWGTAVLHCALCTTLHYYTVHYMQGCTEGNWVGGGEVHTLGAMQHQACTEGTDTLGAIGD